MSERTESQVFTSFKGLRNTVSPERLSQEELALALDIDLDDVGQIRRRRGRTLALSGDFHSLHKNGERCFVVRDGDLCRVYPGYSTVTLRSGVGPHSLAYVNVGDITYFACETTAGQIAADDTVTDWGKIASATDWESPVLTPSDTLPEVAGYLTSAPPVATALAYLNGRIYLANDRVLWATELFRYDTVDRTRNYFYFERPIAGVAGVTDGLYVGTDQAVYFLSGEYRTMQRRKVHNGGLVPGSIVEVDPKNLGEAAAGSKTAVMFLTHTGVCVGLDSGVCYSITEGVVELPDAQTASAMYREQDGIGQYVGVTTTQGDPTHTARFGDYVDVEIRRFEG